MKQVLKWLFFLCLVGCAKSKPGNDSSPVEKPNTMPIVAGDLPAANEQNPYDDYGAFHNEGMRFIIRKMDAAHDTTAEGVASYTRLFSTMKTGKPDTTDYARNYHLLMQDSANHYAVLIERSLLSPPAKQYLRDLFNSIAGQETRKSFLYATVKSEIVSLESKLMADQRLPRDEYIQLLKATSLARYSAYFWSNLPERANNRKIGGFLRAVIGVLADLSAIDPICHTILGYMTGGEGCGPINISSTMYYGIG